MTDEDQQPSHAAIMESITRLHTGQELLTQNVEGISASLEKMDEQMASNTDRIIGIEKWTSNRDAVTRVLKIIGGGVFTAVLAVGGWLTWGK